MPHCSFKNCKNHSSKTQKKDGISYFRFPLNPVRCEKWISIVARQRCEEFFKPTPGSVLCSKHFVETDKYVTKKGFIRLLKTAVPQIETNDHEVDQKREDELNIKLIEQRSLQPQASSNYATESRSGESSDNNEEEEVEEEEEQTEDREQQVIIKQEPSTSETSEKQPSAPAQPRKRGRRKMFPRSKLTQPMKRKQLRGHDALDNKLLEALKILKKSDLSRKKDECDSFGEYIAISLRKHDERTQSMIKQAINNILFEQEMRMYSVGQYTVVLTGDDENPLVCEEK